jgi:hypothetical protein
MLGVSYNNTKAKQIRIQIKDFKQYIEKTDVHLVTVGRVSYWTYRYEGANILPWLLALCSLALLF